MPQKPDKNDKIIHIVQLNDCQDKKPPLYKAIEIPQNYKKYRQNKFFFLVCIIDNIVIQ